MGTPDLKLLVTAYTVDQIPKQDVHIQELVMVGRSNVGKSSIVNRLSGMISRDTKKHAARISSQPGCTRSLNFYKFWPDVLLVDMPGFGYAQMSLAQRRELGVLVDGYMKDRPTIACVLHVLDARLPLQENDKKMWEWAQHFGYFYLLVLNKCDKLSRSEIEKQKKIISASFSEAVKKPILLTVSAKTGLGMAELNRTLRDAVSQHHL
jgi:GTP-binding protein